PPAPPPPGGARGQRLGAVLHVLYLVFNEGYTSTSGPSLHRGELSAEAIRLARLGLPAAPRRPAWPPGAPPATPRWRGCWRSCCPPTPAGRRGPGPTAGWCPWPSRTG